MPCAPTESKYTRIVMIVSSLMMPSRSREHTFECVQTLVLYIFTYYVNFQVKLLVQTITNCHYKRIAIKFLLGGTNNAADLVTANSSLSRIPDA